MCDDVAAYRTSLCQSPAIWSRIRAISSSGTTTNTSDKSKPGQFVGLIYKLTKFVTRACRPMNEQPTQSGDKLTDRSANRRVKQRPAQTELSATKGHATLHAHSRSTVTTRGPTICKHDTAPRDTPDANRIRTEKLPPTIDESYINKKAGSKDPTYWWAILGSNQ